MTAHHQAELEALREFFVQWETFHSCDPKHKPKAAQYMVELAGEVRKLQAPLELQGVAHGV